MRILLRFALGVVLAVDRHPLLGHHSGANPEPEAEEMRRNWGQIHGSVRLRAVQEDGDGSDGHVRRRKRVQHDLPPGEVPQAVFEPVDGRA